jgi:hypothetical protein
MDFIFQYLDALWLLVALLIVKPHQRLWACGFFILCMIMMRMQIELMASTGFTRGFLGLLPYDARTRGLAVYSLAYVIYLVLVLFSPYARGTLLMAASISVFFAALFTSMIVMCL